MRHVTEAELRTRVRDRTQMYGSAVADAMLTTLIREGAHALWDLLISVRGPEYFSKNTTLATVANQEVYDLPSNFYRLLGVSVNEAAGATLAGTRSGWQKITRASHHDVPALLNAASASPYSTRYQLSKKARGQVSSTFPVDQLLLYPVPSGVWTVLVTYVPTLMSQSEDLNDENSQGLGTYTYDGVHGWEEFIVLWVSIRLLAREESSTTDLRRDLAEVTDRIKGLAAREDVEPEYVSDVRGGLDRGLFPARQRGVW